jgi:hypothetical protein
MSSCIHGINRSHCWCNMRHRDHGLVNGQAVEFSGEKIHKFIPHRTLPLRTPIPPAAPKRTRVRAKDKS